MIKARNMALANTGGRNPDFHSPYWSFDACTPWTSSHLRKAKSKEYRFSLLYSWDNPKNIWGLAFFFLTYLLRWMIHLVQGTQTTPLSHSVLSHIWTALSGARPSNLLSQIRRRTHKEGQWVVQGHGESRAQWQGRLLDWGLPRCPEPTLRVPSTRNVSHIQEKPT